MTWQDRLKIALGVALLVAFIWAGMHVYWHFSITGAIRAMENDGGPAKPGSAATRNGYSMHQETMDDLESAGCRALPYMVAALFTTKNQATAMACVELIRKIAAPQGDEPPGVIRSECPDPGLEFFDPPEERARKCEPIRVWWNAHAKEYHEDWRIWTGHCPRN